jgi:hypothetical protein
MGFGDFVDIINPLQHIPIIATIYRNRTGDTLGFASRVIGGGLWAESEASSRALLMESSIGLRERILEIISTQAFFGDSDELKK